MFVICDSEAKCRRKKEMELHGLKKDATHMNTLNHETGALKFFTPRGKKKIISGLLKCRVLVNTHPDKKKKKRF